MLDFRLFRGTRHLLTVVAGLAMLGGVFGCKAAANGARNGAQIAVNSAPDPADVNLAPVDPNQPPQFPDSGQASQFGQFGQPSQSGQDARSNQPGSYPAGSQPTRNRVLGARQVNKSQQQAAVYQQSPAP